MSVKYLECPCGRGLRVTQPEAGVLEAVDPRDDKLVARITVLEGDVDDDPPPKAEYEIELLSEGSTVALRSAKHPNDALGEVCAMFRAYDRVQRSAEDLRARLNARFADLEDGPSG